MELSSKSKTSQKKNLQISAEQLFKAWLLWKRQVTRKTINIKLFSAIRFTENHKVPILDIDIGFKSARALSVPRPPPPPPLLVFPIHVRHISSRRDRHFPCPETVQKHRKTEYKEGFARVFQNTHNPKI